MKYFYLKINGFLFGSYIIMSYICFNQLIKTNKMRNSNIYTVKEIEVECLPSAFTKSGKDEYSSAVGFGMGTSIKKALADCRAMLSATQNGGTPILGNKVILKGGIDITAKVYNVYNPYDKWSERDQATFESNRQKHNDELELAAIDKLP